MNSEINSLITEARNWLNSQEPAESKSVRWVSLGNFAAFVSAIEIDSSSSSIAKASWALNHHISDQYEWSDDYCKFISSFLRRAQDIERNIRNG